MNVAPVIKQSSWVLRSFYIIQGVFFNWPPPKSASTGSPLNLVSMRITLRSSDTKIFYDHRGGQSGTLTFFRNWLLTGQHLANKKKTKKHPVSCMSGAHPMSSITWIQLLCGRSCEKQQMRKKYPCQYNLKSLRA